MGRVLQPFEYYEPTTIAEAVALAAVPDASLLAGGCYLVPGMRCGIVRPRRVVSVMKVEGLDGFGLDSRGELRVGAKVKIRELRWLARIPGRAALSDAAEKLQPADIGNMGTLVGNVCSAVPFYDLPVALTALGAEVRISDGVSERTLPVDEFYPAPRTTAAQAGELVTSIALPPIPPNSGSAFGKIAKAPRREGDLNRVSAACFVALDGERETIVDAAIAVGNCGVGPRRVPAVESAIRGRPAAPETYARAADAAAAGTAPMTDAAWVEETRRALVRALVRDALEQAADRARSPARS